MVASSFTAAVLVPQHGIQPDVRFLCHTARHDQTKGLLVVLWHLLRSSSHTPLTSSISPRQVD